VYELNHQKFYSSLITVLFMRFYEIEKNSSTGIYSQSRVMKGRYKYFLKDFKKSIDF